MLSPDWVLRCLSRLCVLVALQSGSSLAFDLSVTLIMLDMDLDDAYQAAEVLLMAVSDLHIPHEGSVWDRVTVSMGCAQWTAEQGGDTEQIIDSLMRSADAALYEAKRLGRNQLVAAREPSFNGAL